MIRFPQHVPHDETVLDAWRDQVTVAAQTPWLARELVRRGDALLPQFASWYTYLRRLPRRTRRALQRRVALSLGGVALLFALSQGLAQAAVIEVDGATCNLAHAITAANTDTATGGCPAGNGADTLRLEPPGRTVTLITALPTIVSDITIDGQEGTIEKANNAPVFDILQVLGDRCNFTLQNTTITGGSDGVSVRSCVNGRVTIESSTISDNGRAGIYMDETDGDTIIKHTTISGNRTGIYSVSSYNLNTAIEHTTISGNNASGIFTSPPSGDFTINNSIISGNGRGISINGEEILPSPLLTIKDSTIRDNSSETIGFGIQNTYSDTIIKNNKISGNARGGIYGYYDSFEIYNSTISGNQGEGVELRNSFALINSSTISDNTFSGVRVDRFDANINNSTISGNANGGIIGQDESEIRLHNSTITGNTSNVDGGGINLASGSSLELSHSIISGNISPGAGAEIASDYGGSMTSNFNVFGFNNQAGVNVAGFTPAPSDIVPAAGVSVSDILDPNLADNGGPTQIHALVSGSPAIDAGNGTCTDTAGNPLLIDQRGEVRPVDGNGDGRAACDIGSFELQRAQLQREVINLEGIPAGTVVTEVLTDGGFGPIKVRGKLDDGCPHNAAVVFDSSCPGGVCSGGDQDLGSPNESFGGPGQGKGEVGSRWANDAPLGNLLIVHEACDELSDGVVKHPDDTDGASTITLKFPQPVKVFSYTIIDNERDERDKVKLFGEQGERLATLTGPATGNNGKAVVQTTSDGSGIGGVIRMVFDRKGSRGIDNIVLVPEGPHALGWAKRR